MTDDIILLEETDVRNDLEEYQTYTVVVTVKNTYSNPEQGSGNHKLQYIDDTETTRYLTLWANSTPEPVYDFDFEQDATYTLTEVQFTTNESGGRVFYNLNATEETEVSRGPPEDKNTTNQCAETDASGDSTATDVVTEEAVAKEQESDHTTESPSLDDHIDDALSEVPAPATTQTGHALTAFASTSRAGSLTVHEYELVAVNGYLPDDEEAALRDTYKARRKIARQHDDWPVVAVVEPLTLVALEEIDGSAIDIDDFRLKGPETRCLDYERPQDRQTLKDFLETKVKRQLEGDYRTRHGIHKILSQEPIVERENFRLHERYNLSFSVTPEGRLYLFVDFRHKIISDYRLDEVDQSRLYRGLRVNVSYRESGKGAYLDELLPERATDSLRRLGNRSVVQYHRDAKQVSQETIDEFERADRRVVQVTKQGRLNTETYPQELLVLQPHFENLKSFAPAFNEATQGKTRLSGQRCLERSTEFMEGLDPISLQGSAVAFDPTPLSESETYSIERLFETDADILQFGDGQSGDHPKRITSNSVYQPPSEFNVCIIHPDKGPHAERWTNLERMLSRIGAEADEVDRYEYSIDDTADAIYGDLIYDIPDENDYTAACVILPPDGFNLGASDPSDIYHEVKKALRQKHIDSQMAHIDTLADDNALPNIALGLIAAAGGIPFTAEDSMPGDADLFIGIDVSHRYPKDSDDRVHIAASTTSIYDDGTILGYTSANPQAGEKIPPGKLKDIVRQAVVGYKQERGEYPEHIVIHRDGFMNEDLSPVEDLLAEFSITYDIVEVRKQSPARVLDLENGKASVPDKGVAAINESDAHAILSSFGKPESQATSQYTGLPQPIQVEREAGDTDIGTLASQVYLLSQSHIGAISTTARLPITTYYADRASEAAAEEYLPPTSRLRKNIGFL
ncbi:Piwi domain-containing protein [Halorubrum sp. Hd13]|uniref:Piwi domain-containing protein n=1 Tax=Halorubrum sp. Hd13 TaxID=1480728 RepID=UPI000B97EE6A|nr:Piwi domain-containing protein [Halorubrum sp. Hd13]OYR38618.1 stem cell self-renewal protein Piwi domain protein [Halorubrum sp. Hd13]